MALKFLNKKGWHTGSLRNIENVWKAEQKHEAEQKKLEELRKQIHEERERSEFRLLQQQAGLVPKQERLDFLYESGLAVGKGSSDAGGSGFKTLESLPTDTPSSSSDPKQSASASVPGALFEEKPQSANDAWRKLHSDPLLLIRQREQEALARVKNNPVQMARIRKSVEEKKHKEKTHDKKEHRKKDRHSSSRHQKHSSSKQKLDSKNVTTDGETRTGKHRSSSYNEHYDKARAETEDGPSRRESRSKENRHRDLKYKEQSPSGLTDRKSSSYNEHYDKARAETEDGSSRRESRSKENRHRDLKYKEQSPSGLTDPKNAVSEGRDAIKRNHDKSKHEKYSLEHQTNFDADRKERENISVKASYHDSSTTTLGRESHFKRRDVAPKLSEEERAAKLRAMQADAELHEEQRWKRLRKAEDDDAREATRASVSSGRNFLDAAKKSVYGAEKGGISTIEESVRRRTHYLQGRSDAGEGNAFRR